MKSKNRIRGTILNSVALMTTVLSGLIGTAGNTAFALDSCPGCRVVRFNDSPTQYTLVSGHLRGFPNQETRNGVTGKNREDNIWDPWLRGHFTIDAGYPNVPSTPLQDGRLYRVGGPAGGGNPTIYYFKNNRLNPVSWADWHFNHGLNNEAPIGFPGYGDQNQEYRRQYYLSAYGQGPLYNNYPRNITLETYDGSRRFIIGSDGKRCEFAFSRDKAQDWGYTNWTKVPNEVDAFFSTIPTGNPVSLSGRQFEDLIRATTDGNLNICGSRVEPAQLMKMKKLLILRL